MIEERKKLKNNENKTVKITKNSKIRVAKIKTRTMKLSLAKKSKNTIRRKVSMYYGLKFCKKKKQKTNDN